jgi:arginase family enzyme
MPMTPHEELALLLRPAAGGLYVVSTGRAEQLAVQRTLYGVDTEAEVDRAFREALDRIARARIVMYGVPSDVGAGFRRGANLAPQRIRAELLSDQAFRTRMEREGVVDIGDVFVVPQLLHDDMLSPDQLAATRAVLYPGRTEALPVSPLSIAERALDLVFAINPSAKPFMLGGDHSNAWPVAAALSRARTNWGVVQPDAHTDLLSERLGVKYCFATWSYHANELIGRGGRMVQVGTRASRRDRDHWESTLGVRQFWAADVLHDPEKALDDILAHLRRIGVDSVYFSNDIDGTDEAWADATGTPEPGGLDPEFLVALIRRLGREIGICAADVVEVAPPLARRPDDDGTVKLAARYVRETLEAMLVARNPRRAELASADALAPNS